MRVGPARRVAIGLVLAAALAGQTAPDTASAQSGIMEQQGGQGTRSFADYTNAAIEGPEVPPGAWVEVSCKVYDPTIASANPDGYWYRLASEPWNDQYYAIANTFMNGDVPGGPYVHDTNFAIPDCGAAVSQAPTPNLFYNRSAAVRWALDHAQDEQTVGAMCTWFVSNALWAGGVPTSETWTDEGSFGTVQQRPGTVAAWAVPEFLDYIQANFDTTWTPLGSLTDQNNAVPHAEPGDIIAYDWGDGSGISHIAFVVSISEGSYPNVAEWGQPDRVTPFSNFHSPYQSRGWTWSEMSNTWLQESHEGDVQAYLLHFNGGVFVDDF